MSPQEVNRVFAISFYLLQITHRSGHPAHAGHSGKLSELGQVTLGPLTLLKAGACRDGPRQSEQLYYDQVDRKDHEAADHTDDYVAVGETD